MGDYQKLNDYFVPRINKYDARYMFLKSRPEAGETIVAYVTRLREKAYGYDFGSSNDERILEHREPISYTEMYI